MRTVDRREETVFSKRTKVKPYHMDRIPALLAKELGTIARGKEAGYALCLFPMESSLLKLHREEPRRNDQRALEAV